MADMDDFFAFSSTTDSGSSGSIGCLFPGLTWVLIALGVLGWIIALLGS